jgi:lysophospholipid hydrolase
VHLGLFYVIEGFLDILLPEPDSERSSGGAKSTTEFSHNIDSSRKDNRKHLFTVKPGGIAGYLGMS